MNVLTKMPAGFDSWQSVVRFDDLVGIDAAQWSTLAADAGASVAAQDEDNGVVLLTTGGTNNNECAIYTGKKIFKFADKRNIFFEAMIKYSEAATNAANVAVGLSSAALADTLVDDTGVPASNFSGALIYKSDGGTVWKAIVSLGTTQSLYTIAAPAGWSNTTPGGSDWVRLGVLFQATEDPAQDYGTVSFFIDGRQCYDAADTSRNKPLKHRFSYASAAAMQGIVYCKAGTGASQTLRVDSICYSQTRTYGY